MPVHDDLGCRMKTFYEQIPKTKLMRRCPFVATDDLSIHLQENSKNHSMKF